MISIATEEKIRKLLSCGLSELEIADNVGVSRRPVWSIRKMQSLIAGVCEEKREEIRRLLLTGIPVRAVALQTLTPNKTVNAVRRFYYLHKRSIGGREKCPTCGSIMLPPDTPKRLVCKHEIRSNVDESNIPHLCRIAEDVVALDGLRIISNPLFYHLARRAEKTLEAINGKKTNAA